MGFSTERTGALPDVREENVDTGAEVSSSSHSAGEGLYLKCLVDKLQNLAYRPEVGIVEAA